MIEGPATNKCTIGRHRERTSEANKDTIFNQDSYHVNGNEHCNDENINASDGSELTNVRLSDKG